MIEGPTNRPTKEPTDEETGKGSFTSNKSTTLPPSLLFTFPDFDIISINLK